MKIFISQVILFAVALSQATGMAGLARFRGLFLWNGAYASANATYFDVSDSVSTPLLAADASLRAFRASGSWENQWKIRSRWESLEGEAGVRGNFRFLDLSARASGNNEFGRAAVQTVFHASDSLFWLGMRTGGGTVGKIRTTWTSDSPNGILDTMHIDYRGKFTRSGILLGGHTGRHYAELSGDFFHSRRADIDGEHYAFRDSSKLWTGGFLYRYRNGTSEWKFRANALHLDAELFGLRTDGENVKRFAYLPAKANVAAFGGAFQNPSVELSLNALLGDLRLPKETARFKETLAPNRALDQSILQTLSFALFKRNYRLWGNASGSLWHAKIGKTFHFSPARLHLAPQMAANFLYAAGEFDMDLRSETLKAFVIRESRTDSYRGRVRLAGAVAELSLLAESPEKRFYGKVSAAQIIPFFVQKKLDKESTEEKESSSGGESTGNGSTSSGKGSSSASTESSKKAADSNEGLRKTEHLSPFKTGFGIEVSIGFRF